MPQLRGIRKGFQDAGVRPVFESAPDIVGKYLVGIPSQVDIRALFEDSETDDVKVNQTARKFLDNLCEEHKIHRNSTNKC